MAQHNPHMGRQSETMMTPARRIHGWQSKVLRGLPASGFVIWMKNDQTSQAALEVVVKLLQLWRRRHLVTEQPAVRAMAVRAMSLDLQRLYIKKG